MTGWWFQIILMLPQILGKWSKMTTVIFFKWVGWNHQLDEAFNFMCSCDCNTNILSGGFNIITLPPETFQNYEFAQPVFLAIYTGWHYHRKCLEAWNSMRKSRSPVRLPETPLAPQVFSCQFDHLCCRIDFWRQSAVNSQQVPITRNLHSLKLGGVRVKGALEFE